MNFADDMTRQVIGATDVMASLCPASAWGAQLVARPRWYGVADEAAWREELGVLEAVDRWWTDDVARDCTPAFQQLPTIERPLLTLESGGTLDEVALFELKRFFYWSAALARVAGPGIAAVDVGWEARLNALMATIHPERHASPRFILSAALDERLAAARQRIKRARSDERSARHALEAQIVADRGGKFDVSGRYVPAHPPISGADPRLRALGDGKFEVIDPTVDALSAAIAAANDACWDIEVELRAGLSDRLRGEVPWLLEVRDVLGELDRRCALVELKREWAGCWPQWGTQMTIGDGRHPRLLEVLELEEVQPISITLDARPAVVTGPNMGGKSVLLELVGLCQWCAQHGYPVPAASCTFLPADRLIYVGSEGEEASPSGLSSFGREVRRVVEQSADGARCLWLLDELGRGTHPDEGAAIARDFITYRHKLGDQIIAATHFPSLASMPDAAHFRIAGISHPEALQALKSDPSLADIECALRAAMDYRPMIRMATDPAVPRDARLVASILGLDLGEA